MKPLDCEDEMRAALRQLIVKMCDENTWCDDGANTILKSIGLAPIEGQLTGAEEILNTYKRRVERYYREGYGGDGPGEYYHATVAELEDRLALGLQKQAERRIR